MFLFLFCLAGHCLSLIVGGLCRRVYWFGVSIWCDPFIVGLRVFGMQNGSRLIKALILMGFAFIVYPKPLFILVLSWTLIRWLRGELHAQQVIDNIALNLIANYLFDL